MIEVVLYHRSLSLWLISVLVLVVSAADDAAAAPALALLVHSFHSSIKL